MSQLQILCLTNCTLQLYKKYIVKRSLTYDINASGFNLICVHNQTIPANSFSNIIKFNIKCKPTLKHGYFIALRSSTSLNTKIRLSTQIGVIDHDYRGELVGIVDNYDNNDYNIKCGDKLVQIVFPNFKPFDIKLVNNLDITKRNNNGLGSTNIL